MHLISLVSANCTDICEQVQHDKERLWRTAKAGHIFKWARKKGESHPVITSETNAVFSTLFSMVWIFFYLKEGGKYFFSSQCAYKCMQSSTCTCTHCVTADMVSRWAHMHSLVQRALLAGIWTGQVTQGEIFPEIREVLHKSKCLFERC